VTAWSRALKRTVWEVMGHASEGRTAMPCHPVRLSADAVISNYSAESADMALYELGGPAPACLAFALQLAQLGPSSHPDDSWRQHLAQLADAVESLGYPIFVRVRFLKASMKTLAALALLA
jgi:hypothetical protein